MLGSKKIRIMVNGTNVLRQRYFINDKTIVGKKMSCWFWTVVVNRRCGADGLTMPIWRFRSIIIVVVMRYVYNIHYNVL